MSLIDYEKLRDLNSAASSPHGGSESDESRGGIMDKYDALFLKPKKVLPAIPNKPTKAFQLSHAHIKRPKSRFAAQRGKLIGDENADPSTQYDDPLSHDVRFYTAMSRKKPVDALDGQVKNEELVFSKEKNIGALYNLMKKLPFERSRKEKKKAYRLLRELWPNELRTLLEDKNSQHSVLKELSTVAVMDTYHEAGLTVFGNTGLYMILKGSVRPQTLPYLRCEFDSAEADSDDFPCPTPILHRKLVHRLTAGDWFGTLKKVENREINSKVLTLVTLEPCYFLKISIAHYKQILTKIKQRIQSEKMSVVQSVAPYNKWAGMSVGKLAALIDWKVYPAGTIVMEEGVISPYIVFIRNGSCNVFRQVEAIKSLPNGRKKRIFKNVLMGQLGEGDALGEYSILEQKPFACTVMAVTDLDAGVIYPQRLEELDITIRTLFAQSVRPKFADITDDGVQSNFIEQEMKDDWQRLKQKVLIQTMNHCGIRPGYGKWSNPAIFTGQL